MRSKKAVRGVVMAAGVLAVMTVASPAASASYVHNIVIDGKSLPANARSVSVWGPGDGNRPGACITGLNSKNPAPNPIAPDVDTGILIPSDGTYSFTAETGTTCASRFNTRNTIACMCNVKVRESDPWTLRVVFPKSR